MSGDVTSEGMEYPEMSHRGVWRVPAEETVDLYPGLVVHDGRVSGSITVDRSRLPLWAFIHTALTDGWDRVEEGWSPTEHYGFTEEHLAEFLYDLLELRGEFGRLLLVLAGVERAERQLRDDTLAPHGPIVNITPGDPDAVQLPDSWWETPDLIDRVRQQMLCCLAALDHASELAS